MGGGGGGLLYTVEPLFGTSRFVLCREVNCPLSEVIFYRVCIHEYFRLVLCWEVCPLSECPLLEFHCNIVEILQGPKIFHKL